LKSELFQDKIALDVLDEMKLFCGLCTQVLDHPQTVLECQHTFCKRCLDDWMKRKVICPTCMDTISLVFPNKMALEYISKQKINCPRFKKGCNAVGRVGGDGKEDFLETHRDKCELLEISCPFATLGCDVYQERRMIRRHISKCTHAVDLELLASYPVWNLDLFISFSLISFVRRIAMEESSN
jgi:hypothetical protein